jgi:phosphocarrier protein
MMLAAAMGSKLVVETDGPDEDEAMGAVTGLIAARFEENE